jgi:ribonuclease-3
MITLDRKKETIAYFTKLTKIKKIKEEEVLLQSFVHKSYAMDYSEEIPHNERLEFLGDAILDTIIAKQLFDDFPEYTEAKLTLYKIALVREETLALVAKEINLGEHILISK